MFQNKCNESNAPSQVQNSPFSQVKFPLGIPAETRKGPRGESSQKYDQGKTPKKTAGLHGGRKKPPAKSREPTTEAAETRSSSETGLSFLPICSNDDNMEDRIISYQDQTGTSFGAHLLRKSRPLFAHALDEKLNFKRNSNVENITNQPQRKMTQPSFINEIDSEELMQLRQSIPNHLSPHPLPPPLKRNMVHNQFLTTGRRAKQGLQYTMATNFPHLPPDPPTGSPPPTKHEVHDVCGRKSHHPKLRARELGKRLCEAPSMTLELDDLYKEYIQRCPEGGDDGQQSKTCHYLRHAPSPHHREPRRSILKNRRSSGGSSYHSHHADSIGHGHLVHFDAEVDMISRVTKINGLDNSLKGTKGRLKLLRQLGGRITETGTKDQIAQERYPLHVSKKKTFQAASNPADWLSRREQEDLEGKKARQDLARIYFANEATRVVACTNLAAVDRQTSVFKSTMTKPPPFPHFFMDRIEDDVERENKRKEQNKIAAMNNEMNAFDESLKDQPVSSSTLSNFDPLQVPSEKSLQDLKLKVEIMKRQRERDVQATAARNRTRKSYFHRMLLPSFPDMIASDLLDYSIQRATRLSGEEMLFAMDLIKVANQKNFLEGEQVIRGEEEDELLIEEEEDEEEMKKDKMAQDILDVCVDVAIKITNYKTATGKDPTDSLRREWTDAGLNMLNRQDLTDDRLEATEEVVCGEGTSEDDTGSQSGKVSDPSNATADDMNNDASTSGKPDDEIQFRCVVAIKNAVVTDNDQEKNEGIQPVAQDDKPIKTIEVTDCQNLDLDNALTYDGVFLPLSDDSELSRSSSVTHSGSSIAPSLASMDSPGEKSLGCLTVRRDPSRQDGFDYNEFGGESEYFDENNENGEVVIIVEFNNNGEEASEGNEMGRVSKAEVQLVDNWADSPPGKAKKSKGLLFNADDYAKMIKRESRMTTQQESIKFKFPLDMEAKKSPSTRKKTAFRHRTYSDDMDDDDDDDDDHDDDHDHDHDDKEQVVGKTGEDLVSQSRTQEKLKFQVPYDTEVEKGPLKRKKTGFRHKTSLDDVDDDDDDDNDDHDKEHVVGKTGEDLISQSRTQEKLKFQVPHDMEVDKSPMKRKKTAFRPRTSLDDMDDDDDNDDNDKDEMVGETGVDLLYPSSVEDEEEQEVYENDSGEKIQEHEHDAEDPRKQKFKRDKWVYEDLDNISYGMNWAEHEKKYLKHRIKDLKQFSKIWGKGLQKPANVFTLRERNFSPPYITPLTTKRLPPYNILNPVIARPKFNLRMKNLMRKAEQAKAQQQKITEEKLQQFEKSSNEDNRTLGIKPEIRKCSEKLKGSNPKERRPSSWQQDIEEYECRRMEREKLQEKLEVDYDDYSKRLGFDVFYNDDSTAFQQKFIRHERKSSVIIADEKEMQKNRGGGGGGTNKNDASCGGATDECKAEEVAEDDNLKDEDANLQNEEQEYQPGTIHYLEILGEGEIYVPDLEYIQIQEKPYTADKALLLSEASFECITLS